MRRARKLADSVLIELFLDMLAAERGASKNTLAAYARDLADLSADLAATQSAIQIYWIASSTKAIRRLGEIGLGK